MPCSRIRCVWQLLSPVGLVVVALSTWIDIEVQPFMYLYETFGFTSQTRNSPRTLQILVAYLPDTPIAVPTTISYECGHFSPNCDHALRCPRYVWQYLAGGRGTAAGRWRSTAMPPPSYHSVYIMGISRVLTFTPKCLAIHFFAH